MLIHIQHRSHFLGLPCKVSPIRSINHQFNAHQLTQVYKNRSLLSISCGEDLFSSEDDDDMLPESGHVFIVLKEGWSATNISRGHVIHIIWDPDESVKDAFFKAGGGFEGAQAIGNRDLVTVDDANHWLVVCPDQL